MNEGTPTARNRDRILEAIDQLRKRKARPDITRICSYLFRRFHVNSAEAKSDLDWCVANNVVLKVEYKGSISYRNAAKKWAQMRHRELQGYANNQNAINKLVNSKHFMELLRNVFAELVVQEPDYLDLGFPTEKIIEKILKKDRGNYSRNCIAVSLVQEVKRRNLIKLPNGNFLMGPLADGKPSDDDKRQQQQQQRLQEERQQLQLQERQRRHREEEEAAIFGVWRHKDDEQMQSRRAANNHNNAEEDDDDNARTAESCSPHLRADAESDDKNGVIIKPKKRMIAKVQAAAARNMDKYDTEIGGGGDDKQFEGRQETGNVRLGGRRKKAKKVFDPSDTHIPKRRGRPAGSLNKSTIEKQQIYHRRDEDSRPDSRSSTGSREHGGVCSVCLTQSKRTPNERMVACRECSNKAHYSCLNGDDMMLKMYPDNTWQCPHCKTCVVCFETSNSGNLIVCSVCADGYHANCHQPRIIEKIGNGQKWLCVNCRVSDAIKINDIQSNIGDTINNKVPSNNDSDKELSRSNSVQSSHSPFDSISLSPVPPELSPHRKCGSETPDEHSDSNSGKWEDEDPNIDPSIPDATHWTPDEVYQYFAQYFPDEAKVFKEQEIDGRSLLLLKRLDVLTNLNLKLGPALKIYRHITMLQVRRDDRSLYWL